MIRRAVQRSKEAGQQADSAELRLINFVQRQDILDCQKKKLDRNWRGLSGLQANNPLGFTVITPFFGPSLYWTLVRDALQMKSQFESNIMSGSHSCVLRNVTVQPPSFQNRIILFCLPIPILTYLREIYCIYFQDRSVYIFCCSQICGLILGIYKSSQPYECGNWDWGWPNSQKRNT